MGSLPPEAATPTGLYSQHCPSRRGTPELRQSPAQEVRKSQGGAQTHGGVHGGIPAPWVPTRACDRHPKPREGLRLPCLPPGAVGPACLSAAVKPVVLVPSHPRGLACCPYCSGSIFQGQHGDLPPGSPPRSARDKDARGETTSARAGTRRHRTSLHSEGRVWRAPRSPRERLRGPTGPPPRPVCVQPAGRAGGRAPRGALRTAGKGPCRAQTSTASCGVRCIAPRWPILLQRTHGGAPASRWHSLSAPWSPSQLNLR